MQKWNISIDRAERVDEKNGVICLFIMFIPKVVVMAMSNMAHLLYFLLLTEKRSHSYGKIFRYNWKILFSSFRKCYGLLNSSGNKQDVDPWKCRVSVFFPDLRGFFYFYPQYLTNSNSKSIPFFKELSLKNSVRSFICACPNCDFFLASAENKNKPFWTF